MSLWAAPKSLYHQIDCDSFKDPGITFVPYFFSSTTDVDFSRSGIHSFTHSTDIYWMPPTAVNKKKPLSLWSNILVYGVNPEILLVLKKKKRK